MAGNDLPSWAVRLREERVRRLWSQKIMAVCLRNAADEQTQDRLPPRASIQRYIRDYEAGRHFPGDLYAELYCRAFGLTREALFNGKSGWRSDGPGPEQGPTEQEATSLVNWIATTNISDDAIENIARETGELAETHTRRSPRAILADVVRVHRQVQDLLKSGKQRFRQTRELYRLDADLLAHTSLLLGDLHFDSAAAVYGSTATLYAREAGVSQAVALSVEAKTARWRLQFADSAELARRGFECSPAGPIRILLSCQEANAAALLGDVRRARDALNRAREASDGQVATDSGLSAWSCPRPRQALFALAVEIQCGNPDAALRAAGVANEAWARGDPWVAATWAQVRLGAGVAYLIKGDLEAAQSELASVLALDPAFRMATVVAYTAEMDRRLRQRRFRRDPVAMQMQEQIKAFTSGVLPNPSEGNA
jgi:tetratricopeptide (TPR) repeat protein